MPARARPNTKTVRELCAKAQLVLVSVNVAGADHGDAEAALELLDGLADAAGALVETLEAQPDPRELREALEGLYDYVRDLPGGDPIERSASEPMRRAYAALAQSNAS